MNNVLKLHEAIAVVLLSRPSRSADTQLIANVVNRRRLYCRKDNKPVPAYQIMMRTSLSSGAYGHLFRFENRTQIVTLK